MVWRFGDVNILKKFNVKSALSAACIVLFAWTQYYYSDQAWQTSSAWRKRIDKYMSVILKDGYDCELKETIPFDIVCYIPRKQYMSSVIFLKRYKLSVFSDTWDY